MIMMSTHYSTIQYKELIEDYIISSSSSDSRTMLSLYTALHSLNGSTPLLSSYLYTSLYIPVL